MAVQYSRIIRKVILTDELLKAEVEPWGAYAVSNEAVTQNVKAHAFEPLPTPLHDSDDIKGIVERDEERKKCLTRQYESNDYDACHSRGLQIKFWESVGPSTWAISHFIPTNMWPLYLGCEHVPECLAVQHSSCIDISVGLVPLATLPVAMATLVQNP